MANPGSSPDFGHGRDCWRIGSFDQMSMRFRGMLNDANSSIHRLETMVTCECWITAPHHPETLTFSPERRLSGQATARGEHSGNSSPGEETALRASHARDESRSLGWRRAMGQYRGVNRYGDAPGWRSATFRVDRGLPCDATATHGRAYPYGRGGGGGGEPTRHSPADEQQSPLQRAPFNVSRMIDLLEGCGVCLPPGPPQAFRTDRAHQLADSPLTIVGTAKRDAPAPENGLLLPLPPESPAVERPSQEQEKSLRDTAARALRSLALQESAQHHQVHTPQAVHQPYERRRIDPGPSYSRPDASPTPLAEPMRYLRHRSESGNFEQDGYTGRMRSPPPPLPFRFRRIRSPPPPPPLPFRFHRISDIEGRRQETTVQVEEEDHEMPDVVDREDGRT